MYGSMMMSAAGPAAALLSLKQDKLKLLAQQFPTIDSACAEIINLNSILNLPKGTEHFISDVHGEYEAFIHVLRNCSGVIRTKAADTFKGTMSEDELREFVTMIYYPEEKLPLLVAKAADKAALFHTLIRRAVTLCRVMARKYTRSRVRKTMPAEFAYAIEELLHEHAFDATATANNYNRSEYTAATVGAIVSTGSAEAFLCALAHMIQRLAVDCLHVVGDIYDRGPGAEIILDTLCKYHTVDVQWGNHDIVWMGAAAGSDVCIANNIRIALRYSNMKTLEEGYAISMLPLASFAAEVYRDDPCKSFIPKPSTVEVSTPKERELIGKMHKALAVIQTKLEAQLIRRHPEWDMEDRLLLDMIDFTNYTIKLPGGKVYELNDKSFPTVKPESPNQLTPEEQSVVERLRASHLRSERLQRHAEFLFSHGGAYLIRDSMLLFHGCVPLTAEGEVKETSFTGERLKGRQLFDKVDMICRQGFYCPPGPLRQNGMDMMWYLWVGKDSPLFGKDKMATFERYFIDDQATWKEAANPYYKLRDTAPLVTKLLIEFGVDHQSGVVVNGHTPVKAAKGENPVKAQGKCLVIDGGFSKAYQKETGLAGYTLISNSLGLALASHKPFVSLTKAIYENEDLYSDTTYLTGPSYARRTYIKDTDLGKQLQKQADSLRALIHEYRLGNMRQKVDAKKEESDRSLPPSVWLGTS